MDFRKSALGIVLALVSPLASTPATHAASCIDERSTAPVCVGDIVRLRNAPAIGRVAVADEVNRVAYVDWGVYGVGSGRGRVPRMELLRSITVARNGVSRGGTVELIENRCLGHATDVFEDGSAFVQWRAPCRGQGLIEAYRIVARSGGGSQPERPFRLVQRDYAGRATTVPVYPTNGSDSTATVRVQAGDTLMVLDNGRRLLIEIR